MTLTGWLVTGAMLALLLGVVLILGGQGTRRRRAEGDVIGNLRLMPFPPLTTSRFLNPDRWAAASTLPLIDRLDWIGDPAFRSKVTHGLPAIGVGSSSRRIDDKPSIFLIKGASISLSTLSR
jgi:hypothetical protein